MVHIIEILILVCSVVIHEVSHGYAALLLGDKTAKYAGRLTLNPIKHLDLWGSVLLPFILALLPGGLVFGYAKPVPVNPYNLKSPKWGEAIVAFAGPLSNLFIALVFGLFVRFGNIPTNSPFFAFFSLIVGINLVLAVFNLVPVPPLDGSKILFAFAGQKAQAVRVHMERFALFYLLFFIFVIWDFVAPLASFLFKFLIGI